MDEINEKKPRIMLPKDLCRIDAVRYIAFRHGTTPEHVLEHYFVQCGMICSADHHEADYMLTSNEMALIHDLGVHPSMVEYI